MIKIEVAYAKPEEQVILTVVVEAGSDVGTTIRQSGILERYPEIDLEKNRIGVFSKFTTLDTIVREGDRIEIYRPLIADPKEIRRQRAAQGKAMKKGAGS